MTDKMLKYFKSRLLHELERLTEMASRSEQTALENDSTIQDSADKAVTAYTKEFMFEQSSIDHGILLSIRDALERIEKRSYGVCEVCEKEIEFKRLEAVPWTSHCVKCQSLSERSQVNHSRRDSL